MALKQVLITKRKEGYRAQLAERRQKNDDIQQRKAEMQKREAELEAAVLETNENTTDEERAELDGIVAEFENGQQALEDEERENNSAIEDLEGKIADIDRELEELNKRGATPPANSVPPETNPRKDDVIMNNRTKFFGMTHQERDAFLANPDIKNFLQRMREFKGQTRAITGSELLVPEVGLELLRDQIGNYSRLINRVNLRRIKGEARQRIAGIVPEAVWTEMCAKLNELNLTFGEVEMDGYKVGGYIAVCNAILEDSDINLAQFIFDALGQAIGLALDKAIIYGKGDKMPVGIATRLAESAKPAYWGANEPEWKNLSATNIITITNTEGTKLFKDLAKAGAKARSRYATGNRMWIMNDTTHLTLMSEAIGVNAAGAIVSGVNTTMPVVGGEVIVVSDAVVPDNTIICGYGSLYLLVERAGIKLAQSEHVRFLDDQTVFKGTARYDGRPIFGEAFVAIGIGAAPVMTATFAPDTANTEATAS